MTIMSFTDEQVRDTLQWGAYDLHYVARSLFADRLRLQAEMEALRRDAEILRGGIFIGGPRAASVVFSRLHVEAVVDALCAVTGDDESDYTATPLDDNDRATPNETKEAWGGD